MGGYQLGGLGRFKVVTAVLLDIQRLCDVALCQWQSGSRPFKASSCFILLGPEDGGSTILRNSVTTS
jgi:hypothetical protein